jgi:hypothetical protein
MLGYALPVLALTLERQNLINEAAHVGLQAIRIGYDIGDRTQLVTVLAELCPLVHATSPPDQVATYIGMIDSGRVGVRNQPDLISAERARIRGEVLAAIGPAAFERAYNAGAAMDYDQSIAYALDLLSRDVIEGAP